MSDPRRPRGPGSTRERGRAAEGAAARWLENQGWSILARNHSTRLGEVDLVCREGETLCFVEVRSRSRIDYGSPAASVGQAKARRIVQAATHWALQHGGLQQRIRFDVLAVDLSSGLPEFALFRDAFDADGRPR